MARICREDVRYGSGPLPMPKETAPSHWRPVAAPLAVLAVAMLVGGAAHAQGFQVSPIQVQFAPGQLGTTLAVTNNTNEASVIQARPFQWSQSGDTDILKETTDLAVSPPITKIDAGQTQTFRIVLRHAPTGAESSFRLLLDQLPPPATPGTVKVALRFSIPVFSRPGTRIATDIAWRVVVDQAGAVLVATNRGGEHLHILNTTLTPPGGAPLTASSLRSPYILAGTERRWPIQAGARLHPGETLHLAALSDSGPVDATVHVTGP